MFLCHKSKSVQCLSHTSPKWKHEHRVCNFTAKERESYHSMELERAKATESWCKLDLERTASAPRGRRWFLEVPLKYHGAGWEDSDGEAMEIWPKQVTAKCLCSPWTEMLASWQLFEEPNNPSQHSRVQVVDKKGPAKAARPTRNSHATAQAGSSCRAQEAWQVPGTPIPPHSPHPEHRHNGITSTCSHQTVPVSKT